MFTRGNGSSWQCSIEGSWKNDSRHRGSIHRSSFQHRSDWGNRGSRILAGICQHWKYGLWFRWDVPVIWLVVNEGCMPNLSSTSDQQKQNYYDRDHNKQGTQVERMNLIQTSKSVYLSNAKWYNPTVQICILQAFKLFPLRVKKKAVNSKMEFYTSIVYFVSFTLRPYGLPPPQKLRKGDFRRARNIISRPWSLDSWPHFFVLTMYEGSITILLMWGSRKILKIDIHVNHSVYCWITLVLLIGSLLEAHTHSYLSDIAQEYCLRKQRYARQQSRCTPLNNGDGQDALEARSLGRVGNHHARGHMLDLANEFMGGNLTSPKYPNFMNIQGHFVGSELD